jgi:hypothetical protein
MAHSSIHVSKVPSLTMARFSNFDRLPNLNGQAVWPAPGFEGTELGVFMEPEARHGKTKVSTGVQA